MLDAIKNFLGTTGVAQLFAESNWWQYLIMYVIVGVLFYLAIVKKFEPLLLMLIAFGMLLANLPGANLIHLEYFFDEHYIAFNSSGEAIGTLATYFNDFLARIDAEFIGSTLYTIEEGVCTFDFSTLSSASIDTVQQIFRETMGSFATLEDGGVFKAELTCDKGRGYVSAERNKQLMQPIIGVIAIDSIYTPVLKVNYTVENTRVGQITDYDKLSLEAWTDGTISAQEAVSLGAKILTDHLDLFVDLSDKQERQRL